jgi:hypothetical protein
MFPPNTTASIHPTAFHDLGLDHQSGPRDPEDGGWAWGR